jgi:hypothetical protein
MLLLFRCVFRYYKGFSNKFSTDKIRRSSKAPVIYSEGVQCKCRLHFFIILWLLFYNFIHGCLFCMLPFNCVNCEFFVMFTYSYFCVCNIPCMLFCCVDLCIACA